MFCVSITGQFFYRIEGGIVYAEAPSGGDNASYSMPIATFRAAQAEAERVLDQFDAEREVIRLRG